MRTLKKVLLVILSILIAFLCVGLWIGVRGDGKVFIYESRMHQNFELVMEKEIEADGISNLNVQYGMNSNSVYFYENEGENIIVREYLNFAPEEEQLSTVERKGEELLIRGKRRNSFSFFSIGNHYNGYIEVFVPAICRLGLSVVTVSGDIWAECEFAGGNDFYASTTSGDIHFPKVDADEIKLTSTSGDVRLEQATGKSVKVSTTSGDMILGRIDGAAVISSTSGDVHVFGGEGERNVSTVSGEIRMDEINGGFDLSTTSGDIVVAEGKSFGKANTVSGDIHIFFDGLTGNLAIGTTSGEVDLKLPANTSLDLEFSSASGEATTFFDDALSFNKRGTHAEGSYGGGDNKITVSSVSGGLRITER